MAGAALCGAGCAGLLLAAGHAWLGLPLSLLFCVALREGATDRARGLELGWHRGYWTLRRGGAERAFLPGAHRVALPWVVHVSLRATDGGPGESLWLFADALGADEWRALRVRLCLCAAAQAQPG